MAQIRVRRVYDEASPDDGLRILVDRLWPRGMRKEDLVLDVWLKEVAPSTDLRKAYHAGTLNFAAFAARYRAELSGSDEAQAAMRDLREKARRRPVTLLTASRFDESHATVLRDVLGKS